MTNTEQKARELISLYGCDMARFRAKHFADRGKGVMRHWWEGVLRAIQTSDVAGKVT
jgi:hypothetical protein